MRATAAARFCGVRTSCAWGLAVPALTEESIPKAFSGAVCVLPGGTRCNEARRTLELLAPVTLTLLRALARLAAPRRLTSLRS